EGLVGVGVHLHLALDDAEHGAVGVDHEGLPLGGQGADLALDVEGGGDLAVGVGQERVPQGVLGGELGLPGDVVGGDPHRSGAEFVEFGGEVAEVAGLGRAAGRHRHRVEEQHYGAVFEQARERAFAAGLVGEGEVGGGVSDVHGTEVYPR